MGGRSKREYFRAVYVCCQRADRREKQRVLDGLCANTRYRRKYALRLLNGPPPGGRERETERRAAGGHCRLQTAML